MSSTVDQLGKLMVASLRRLGDAGETERACELAAQAWSLLRHEHPDTAERMNGVLHYLTAPPRKPDPAADTRPTAANDDFELEIRHLAPAQRHDLIIKTFHELVPGQGFILINDHDPKPLYYQFAFEYTDQYTWDPIEEGPEVWRVRIGKK